MAEQLNATIEDLVRPEDVVADDDDAHQDAPMATNDDAENARDRPK